jgi:hypothetical protein
VDARTVGQDAVRQLGAQSNDPDLLLSYQRWARRLAADAGGVSAWLWAAFHGKRLPRA